MAEKLKSLLNCKLGVIHKNIPIPNSISNGKQQTTISQFLSSMQIGDSVKIPIKDAAKWRSAAQYHKNTKDVNFMVKVIRLNKAFAGVWRIRRTNGNTPISREFNRNFKTLKGANNNG